ncbi:hypothetical protein GF386_03300 [Candidatus Pacearchaeota archaeon]|nr:hypothetical protein [Candidatus Pacearchaeota archaeon]MBD3283166.1 hypothetical protein [Candidatus Pacearchaeota archaeon]
MNPKVDRLNEYCRRFGPGFRVLDDVRNVLVDFLAGLDRQLDLFESPEQRALSSLEALRVHDGSLYNRWSFSDNRKRRELSVPCEPLKVFIDDYLIPLIKRTKVHECCHGAEPGWSPRRSLEDHLPCYSVLSFDLKSAFNNFTIAEVFDFYYSLDLEGLEEDEKIAVAGFLSMISSSLVDGRRVLPTGASHSPLLFNRGLLELDDELYEGCSRKGFNYTRWLDDITISSQGKVCIEELLGAVELTERYFPVAPNKIFFQKADEPIYLLGHVIYLGRVCKNSRTERDAHKVKPLDYDEWFGDRGYEGWE